MGVAEQACCSSHTRSSGLWWVPIGGRTPSKGPFDSTDGLVDTCSLFCFPKERPSLELDAAYFALDGLHCLRLILDSEQPSPPSYICCCPDSAACLQFLHPIPPLTTSSGSGVESPVSRPTKPPCAHPSSLAAAAAASLLLIAITRQPRHDTAWS